MAETGFKLCNSQRSAQPSDRAGIGTDGAMPTFTPGKRPANCRLDCRPQDLAPALLDYSSGGSLISPGTQ